MSGTDYPNSTTVTCGEGLQNDWDSVGFSTFTAIVGFGDQEPDTTGVTFTITFYDQDMHQLSRVSGVALGHPKPATVTIHGTTRLIVACTLQNTNYGSLPVVLGDGALNP